MTSIREAIRRLVTPPAPIPSGTYHFQAPPDAPLPYRLHLRIEPDGHGVLIVNASIVLHLNATAAEYAYHIIQQTQKEQAVRTISARYRINRTQARQDYEDFISRIQELIHTPDLDPVAYLDFDRYAPYSQEISAPYRLDCALTYSLPAGTNPEDAPNKRVDRELDTSEWKKILDKSWNAGIPHIIFTGGEPTLREDLPELIRYAETAGQVSGLLTDGLRFSDPAYLETVMQTGLDHIMINFQPDNLQAEAALTNVLSADIALVVHLTLTAENAARTTRLMDRLAQMGLEAISLSAVSPELGDTLASLHNHATRLGLSLVWDLPVPYSTFNPISLEVVEDQVAEGAGKAWLYIEPDGDVLPAQGINHVLGNLLNDDWDDIWNQAKSLWLKIE
jgi:pyruvate-formate lyase-activating enzyme